MRLFLEARVAIPGESHEHECKSIVGPHVGGVWEVSALPLLVPWWAAVAHKCCT